MFSKEAVVKFKEVYKRLYNKEISDQEVFEMGTNLLNLYRLLFDAKNPNSKKIT